MIRAFRHATRTLLRNPGFTLVSALTLSIGLAGATAVYAVLERVVLDPLPYPHVDRLVRLRSQVPGLAPDAEWDLSPGQFFFIARESRTLNAIGAWGRMSTTVDTPGGPVRARLVGVTAGTLDVLGATPALGRTILDTDTRPGAPIVAVLSHAFWTRQFGADPRVVGRTLTLFDSPAEIVGVMAPGFELPHEPGATTMLQSDVWVALQWNPNGPFYNNHAFPVVARLKPGTTVDQLQGELEHLTARLPDAMPDVYPASFMREFGFRTTAFPLQAYSVGEIGRNLWLAFAAVGLVLLTACANVANLFLVRLDGRRRELATRAALGAGRRDVMSMVFAETLLVALAAVGPALLLASWGIDLLVSFTPVPIPRLDDVALDASVTGFAFAVAVVSAAGLAVLPALRVSEAGSAALISDGPTATAGRERQRVRSVLVVGQVALALTLTLCAALLVETIHRLRAADTGLRPHGVLTLELAVPPDAYPNHERVWNFYRAALERIRALPGVSAAGLATKLPFTGGYGCVVQGFEDASARERIRALNLTHCASQVITSPGYFEALGIPLLQGRTFTEADNDNPATGAVIVSRAFAERFWPGEDPIGRGIGPNGHDQAPFYRVIGVVGDVYAESVSGEKAVAVYYPITRLPEAGGWSPPHLVRLAVRTDLSNPVSLVPAIREAVSDIDASVPIANAETMQAIVDRSMGRVSFVTMLLSIAAAVALFLAAVGLHVVVSYLVTRRTREIGLRIALGAQQRQVEWLVVRRFLGLVAAGLLLGSLLATSVTGVLRHLLFGVDPTDPVVFAAAVAMLGLVASFASWIPARRAARVDPAAALRVE
ncbi:MAG TPA: ABC transporter permease [Vicinamibacterales bacterium]